MSRTHKPCLVLNADYSPITVISWQKAIVWYYRHISENINTIEIIDYHTDDFITTSSKPHHIPAIIKVCKYIRLSRSRVHFCRKNLFLRDNYTCQYCNTKLHIYQLTYDHIVPKSRCSYMPKNKCTNWTNIVTSCVVCNRKKGNRTPEEANMQLVKSPYEPKYSDRYLPWYDEAIRIYQTYNIEIWKPFITIK
jgi:5-methylcytosine-specific restriction endonuclease McrA